MSNTFNTQDLVLVADTTPPVIKASFADCEDLAKTLKQCRGNSITILHNGESYTTSKDHTSYRCGTSEESVDDDVSVRFIFTHHTGKSFMLGSDRDTDLVTKVNTNTTYWGDDETSFKFDYIDKTSNITLPFEQSGDVQIQTDDYSTVPLDNIIVTDDGDSYYFTNKFDTIKALSITKGFSINGTGFVRVEKFRQGVRQAILLKATSVSRYYVAFYDWFIDRFCSIEEYNKDQGELIIKETEDLNTIRLYRVTDEQVPF